MLTQSQVITGAAESMIEAGYAAVEVKSTQHLVRMFEDAYGIVAIAYYDDWPALSHSWPDAQGELVEILTEALDQSEPKSWEGYLILVTLDTVPSGSARELAHIRKDINRVRKLVITGEDLSNLSSLHSSLLPVLPLAASADADPSGGLMDALPLMLADSSGLSPQVTAAVIAAFQQNEPLMEAIHREVHES